MDEGFKVTEDYEKQLNFSNLAPYLSNIKLLFFALFSILLILYFPSFSVPFYLDDYPSIIENPAIYDITQLDKIWAFYFPRFIGYLSFSLNYTISGESPFTYHLANFIIHFLAGIGVFFLTRILLTSLKSDIDKSYLYTIPFIAALIFLIAPQQTQAVTYIVQRLSSMSAMFYIYALVTYSYARLNSKHYLFILTFVFAGLALFTKQNTATLPIAVLIIELIFFQKMDKAQWKKFILVSIPVISIFAFTIYQYFDLSLERLDYLTRSLQTDTLSREQYFATQILVVWHYIVQFFIPTDLHLDYDYPVQQSLFSFKIISALIAHIVLIMAAYFYRKQQPIIFFAVVFYYLAHLIESSIVPIPDIVFEHRNYLPNMGLSILVAMLTYLLWQQKNLQQLTLIGLSLLILWFSYHTFSRNIIWTKPVEFYINETKHSPNKERVWADLGKYYLKEKKYNQALKTFGKALNLGKKGNTINALPTTFLNTYFALIYTNQLKKAIYFESIIPINMLSKHDKAVFYYMKGNRQIKMKQLNQAQQSLKTALQNNPDYTDAKTRLATIKLQKQQHTKSN